MIRRILFSIGGAVIVIAVGASIWIFSSVNAASSTTTDTRLSVTRGQGIRTVAAQLYEAKLIRSRQAWVLFAAITGQYRSVLSGNYLFPAGVTGRAALQLLTTGPNDDREVSVTFPEGLRLEEMANILHDKGVISSDAFLQLTRHPAEFIASWPTDLFRSKPSSVDLEGYLFPDTYRFFKDSTAEVVVRRMVENTDQKLTAALRGEIAASGHSLHEIMTMASVLELELRTPNDRAIAADLFWRRIKEGIAMQSDATVNYVTKKGRAQPSIEDTKVDSPYNTYQVRGLPPGPIGNPGILSIQAALRPSPNTYYFYLTAPNGTTIWAATYDQHLENKRRYLGGS